MSKLRDKVEQVIAYNAIFKHLYEDRNEFSARCRTLEILDNWDDMSSQRIGHRLKRIGEIEVIKYRREVK